MYEAKFYEKLPKKAVRCHLCAHHCAIASISAVSAASGKIRAARSIRSPTTGSSRPRSTRSRKNRSTTSCREARTYSFCTVRVQLLVACCHMPECDIPRPASPRDRPGRKAVSPERRNIRPPRSWRRRSPINAQAYPINYTEPTVFYEYAVRYRPPGRGQGLKNIFVSNGYITEAPLREIAPYIHAANIDLKSVHGYYFTAKTCNDLARTSVQNDQAIP